MDIKLHCFYEDNESNIYRCIALKAGKNGYAEAVMEMQGNEVGYSTLFYSVFYRSHYSWQDRECPEFRLVCEVFYTPHVVRSTSVNH